MGGCQRILIVVYRQGSLIADYNVTFAQDPQDVLIVEVECALPRERSQMLGDTPIEVPSRVGKFPRNKF